MMPGKLLNVKKKILSWLSLQNAGRPVKIERSTVMAEDEVARNLKSMDELDFTAWNGADWHGLFAHYYSKDVLVDVHGQPVTHGIEEYIDTAKTRIQASGGTPAHITSRPIRFGYGDLKLVHEQSDQLRMRLAGDNAAALTGQTLTVDGGLVLR
jgi:hypothetical protein